MGLLTPVPNSYVEIMLSNCCRVCHCWYFQLCSASRWYLFVLGKRLFVGWKHAPSLLVTGRYLAVGVYQVFSHCGGDYPYYFVEIGWDDRVVMSFLLQRGGQVASHSAVV